MRIAGRGLIDRDKPVSFTFDAITILLSVATVFPPRQIIRADPARF